MKTILEEIQSGDFARTWMHEHKAGKPLFNGMRQKEGSLQVEKVGGELRKMMSWLNREGEGSRE
jgi:ketol-acid reductoisomerase